MVPSPRLCGVIIKNAAHHCLKFLKNKFPHRVPRKRWTSSQTANPIQRASLNNTAGGIPDKRDVHRISTHGHENGFPTVLAQPSNLRGEESEAFLRLWHFCLAKFLFLHRVFPFSLGTEVWEAPILQVRWLLQCLRCSVTTGTRTPHVPQWDTAADGDGSAITALPQPRILQQHKQTLQYLQTFQIRWSLVLGGNWVWPWPVNPTDSGPAHCWHTHHLLKF